MKQYWRSIEEYESLQEQGNQGQKDYSLKETPDHPHDEPGDNGMAGGHSRRDFLKMLGFGIGYAGLLSGCEMPVRKAIPYLNQPEEIVPGVANYYATTFYDGHDYCSLLVKNREGRPIKIEGNVLSPVTKGGTHARVQASILNLYDMARLKEPMKNNEETTWEAIDAEIIAKLQEISAEGGRAVILTPTVISPSARHLIKEFMLKYPGTEWITYDAISSSAMLQANEMNFKQKAIPDYRFDQADLTVGFNADFLGNWLSPVEYTKQYTKRRSLMDNKTMPRHIQFESYMSLTGSNADYRIPVKPSEESVILLNLYNLIAGAKGADTYPVSDSPVEIGKLAEELLAHEGKSLVVCGTNDLHSQLIVNAINQLLDNYGTTIDLSRPLLTRQGSDDKMAALVDDMLLGKVSGLILCQVNPAYDYPEAQYFADGIKQVKLTVSITERLDETARLAQYVCPDSNYLESWNDFEVKKGCYSLGQPVINKVFNTRQAQDSLLRWMEGQAAYNDYIENYWEENIFPGQSLSGSFRGFWNEALHDGIYVEEVSALPRPAYTPIALQASSEPEGEGFELVLYEKISIGDGKYANNPWLQELPDPVTMATWDNYVCIPPGYAKENRLKLEDVVLINGEIELPVLVQPGQPEGTIAIALGYGRSSAGKVANGLGKNVYPLAMITDGHRRFTGRKVTLERVAGKRYPLALTQSHHTMEQRALAREATLMEYLEDPVAGNEMHMGIVQENLTLYEIPKYEGSHWGLAINLNACIGCGNCVISCQAENNVAVIGKEQVRTRRIMHWIRIDRYYSDEADNPEVIRMPVMCQHCDNAPCENVCPVAATPHSSEGLNQMAYNRCIGTRYCVNNCPYKVRRFNWFEYADNEKFDYNLNNDYGKLVLNPDVTVRSRGVVEKCSFCVQRIQAAKLNAKMENRGIIDGELKTACQQSCPGDAIVFGDMNDPNSGIKKILDNPRTYQLLEQLHTLPSVSYMTKIWNKDKEDKKVNYRRMRYVPHSEKHAKKHS
ncbi:MAG: Fe-S-cluster-containing hydrogenase [Bacteroidales bacterium]